MKKRRNFQDGRAARYIESDNAIVTLHPRSEQTERRIHWRRCVEAWRSERDWMLLIDYRLKLRGRLGEVVVL